ncbi:MULTISPECIES: nuclear transport factor 2 family protein [Sphingobacterium]|uniref:Nuclear transport factor 2 family protein n=1 Tax=Sphingobacterium paramultivorum TaxID=2886510 RepID=A0A7G5DZD1_9SPHI|nr:MULTISPECIES: nuclear transport factor 2 family protein [Sphingobacterium]QMV67106.1 nuclear transport factor 2 family protein [Sphingobacterium paramultivorum]WSO15950.1 nuclear transport factor 2 family protein [Sphingobacterium paramultivorum]
MSLENLKTRQELRDLIDAYAYLGDDKKLDEQMELFTPDATYKVYMNGFEVANTTGTETLKKEFSAHAAEVKTYFTLNGQHTVKIDGNDATGISFSQLKMIREKEGKDIVTDYSVKYEDVYIRQDGKWLIKERIGHFLIIETRTLNN